MSEFSGQAVKKVEGGERWGKCEAADANKWQERASEWQRKRSSTCASLHSFKLQLDAKHTKSPCLACIRTTSDAGRCILH